MNQSRIVWIGILILALAVCLKTSLMSDLVSLLIFGMLPGTNITIPFWVMLTLYPVILIGVVYWLSFQSLFIGEKKRPVKAKKTVAKKTTRKAPARKSTKTAAKRRPRTAV